MKNLILVRHAKSSWDLPLDDIDRSLTPKGIKAAQKVASNSISFLPDTYIIWSSIAKRAQETALIFAETISYPIDKIIFKEDLYTFDESQLLKVIQSDSTNFDTIILFGHNAAITNFVNKFGDISIDNVPTSGLVALQFNSDNWQEIKKGKTTKIIFPQNLK
jgi:phosphohistidine phosphatase